MDFDLVISNEKHWEKDRKKISRKLLGTMYQKIDGLKKLPWGAEVKVKHLHDYESADYRLRVGDYRVLFNLDTEQKKVILLRMKHRSELY